MKPRLTDKVKHGLWLIIARSATVMEAEAGGMDKEERDAVLAASRYADAHWHPKSDNQHDQGEGEQ
jgi:hypothetical protein